MDTSTSFVLQTAPHRLSLNENGLWSAVMVHTFNPIKMETRQKDLCEFQTRLSPY